MASPTAVNSAASPVKTNKQRSSSPKRTGAMTSSATVVRARAPPRSRQQRRMSSTLSPVRRTTSPVRSSISSSTRRSRPMVRQASQSSLPCATGPSTVDMITATRKANSLNLPEEHSDMEEELPRRSTASTSSIHSARASPAVAGLAEQERRRVNRSPRSTSPAASPVRGSRSSPRNNESIFKSMANLADLLPSSSVHSHQGGAADNDDHSSGRHSADTAAIPKIHPQHQERLERAYRLYYKLAMPTRESFKRSILEPKYQVYNVSCLDVELLPWTASGTMVHVTKLHALLAK